MLTVTSVISRINTKHESLFMNYTWARGHTQYVYFLPLTYNGMQNMPLIISNNWNNQ